MKKIVLWLFMISLLFGNNFEKYFNYAKNYYWLTIEEGIKSSVYFKAKKYINLAYEELKKSPNKNNQKKLDALNEEINNFYEIKYYTMNGYFPMLKFVSTSFFFFPKKSRQHTLQKPADMIAVENASESLSNTLDTFTFSQPHLFFNSKNNIWNEILLEKFNLNGNFYIHLNQEIKDILSPTELQQFYSNNITPTIRKKLLNYSDRDNFFLVRIEKIPLEKNDIYVSAYMDIYNKNGIQKEKSTTTNGYSIDERGKWSILIITHFILFLIVVIISYIFERRKTFSIFITILIGFIIGRILPWILVPSFETFMPNGDLNVLYTFWWVFLIGVAIILAPIYGMFFIYSKIENSLSLTSIASKGGIVGLSISAGVAGYLFVPFIFTYGDILSLGEIILYFGLFSVAVLISGYLSGKILDKNDKTEEYLLIVSVFISIILFIGLVHTDLSWLIISSLFTIFISILIFVIRKKEKIKEIKKVTIKEEIENSINGKNYYKFNYYDEILKSIGVEK